MQPGTGRHPHSDVGRYIWRDGRVGACGRRLPPTNWQSMVGGNGWQYHERSGQWYVCGWECVHVWLMCAPLRIVVRSRFVSVLTF